MREVVVIGGGNAGMPAAIFAADAGAHVTVIEKTSELGGALWFTSHAISGAGSRMQQAKGYQDSPQQHYDDIWRIGHGQSDPDILREAVERAAAGIDWLESIGVPFTDHSPYITMGHAPYSVARTHSPQPVPLPAAAAGSGAGRQVLLGLEREVAKRVAAGSISVRYQTAANELIVEGDRVTGVRIEHQGATEVLAADAVVMATGSFGVNFEMLRRYVPDFPDGVISICPPHATGDGIVMAEAAGASLVNMDMYVVVFAGVADRRSPNLALYWIMLPNRRPPATAGDIWVNRYGDRFVREDEPLPDPKEEALMAQPGCEMIAIFDQPMREGLTEQVRLLTDRDLERRTPNIIFSGNTVEELAERLGLPSANLHRTIDAYNASVESGIDEAFGRKAMPKKIDTAPFHAIRSGGMLFLTHGGIKIAPDAAVVRSDGSPFTNLFAAGDAMGAGQVMGRAFAGGQGVGTALTFGILAGQNAARAALGAVAATL